MQVSLDITLSYAPTHHDVAAMLQALSAWMQAEDPLVMHIDPLTRTMQVAFAVLEPLQSQAPTDLPQALQAALPLAVAITLRQVGDGRAIATALARLTSTQAACLGFISGYNRLFDRSPSQAEIQRHLRMNPATVHQTILRLEQLGLITRTPGVARGLEVVYC